MLFIYLHVSVSECSYVKAMEVPDIILCSFDLFFWGGVSTWT